MKKLHCIGYRHIGPEDYGTPQMYLPMQRAQLNIEESCTEAQVKDAISSKTGISRDHIQDIECEIAPEWLQNHRQPTATPTHKPASGTIKMRDRSKDARWNGTETTHGDCE